MNYLIIEDETHNAGLLESLVEKTNPAARLLAVLPTVQESVEWLEANPAPDIVFMDIRLADGLSFEIFSQVKVSSPVVFTTAYDEYALQAFKVYGVAYLLKPIEKEELREALEKVKRLQQKLSGDEVDAIMEMFRTREKTYKSRFLLHYRETYKVIPVEEIDYISLEHKNVYLHLLDGNSIAVPYTLEELDEQLDPQFFFRVNRQYILHINSIDSIHKYFNDKAKIFLKRNRQAEVIVSRIKMPQFKLWLDR
ncbi:LytTR family DNA-binding domain-containing protein [Chitinophaga sp.]|uniref:LytR/AlgR family response regulator transcription factor n=1 Tax=Chitinophaga sp. TaxID=1869181 RepID=UPI002BE06A42|nr:LytTR family DNA-binding domain-containing protein [Chitinophaga sp.]HWV66269.1 LytTR family DNA-binding domain-containing protein [Chitinophaga sp.]